MGVEDILIFYHLSFKDMFVFFPELLKYRTRVLGVKEEFVTSLSSMDLCFY